MSIADFVTRHGGKRPICKILIANNGMAAVRAILALRKWLFQTFEDEKLIQFLVLSTPEDLENNAEYLHLADQHIQLESGEGSRNYANIPLITNLAVSNGVDAVWVGWGFASENPQFPTLLSEKDIVFIGPKAGPMACLGDKISSTLIAQSLGIPCIPWSGDGIQFNLSNFKEIRVPRELYIDCCVSNVVQADAHAERIGYPVMIKAAEGGGGRGIRIVKKKSELCVAYQQVQDELPNSAVFVMKALENTRHLEVQIIADEYGNVTSVFGRDCSVQRRCQKILEESPITVAPANVIAEMERSAILIAKRVGYSNIGTVEYLYDPVSESFYFLELNPRLQVEHPTTEMITGINIPAIQLQISMGIPLHRIKDIRQFYGLPPHGNSLIDFDCVNSNQKIPSPRGHAISARILAENPEEGFQPSCGKLLHLSFRSSHDAWGYFSVNPYGGVHEHADSQIGHIFCYGDTKEDARKNLIVALKELSIRAEFRTTVEYLITLLQDPIYINNSFTVSWLDHRSIAISEVDTISHAICGAAHLGFQFFKQAKDRFVVGVEKGHFLRDLLTTSTNVEFILNDIKYDFETRMISSDTMQLTANKSQLFIQLTEIAQGLLVKFHRKSYLIFSHQTPTGLVLTINGSTVIFKNEVDPSELRSPVPGRLCCYLIPDGSYVTSGEAYAEVEVMKMLTILSSPFSGRFSSCKPLGSLLKQGDLIGRLLLDDNSNITVKKVISAFHGQLPQDLCSSSTSNQSDVSFILLRLKNILEGYDSDGYMSDISEKMPRQISQSLIESLVSLIDKYFLFESQFHGLSVEESFKQLVISNANSDDILSVYDSALKLVKRDVHQSVISALLGLLSRCQHSAQVYLISWLKSTSQKLIPEYAQKKIRGLIHQFESPSFEARRQSLVFFLNGLPQSPLLPGIQNHDHCCITSDMNLDQLDLLASLFWHESLYKICLQWYITISYSAYLIEQSAFDELPGCCMVRLLARPFNSDHSLSFVVCIVQDIHRLDEALSYVNDSGSVDQIMICLPSVSDIDLVRTLFASTFESSITPQLTLMHASQKEMPKYSAISVPSLAKDPVMSNIEPAFIPLLEMERMADFDLKRCKSYERFIFSFFGSNRQDLMDTRLFVRVLIPFSTDMHECLESFFKKIMFDLDNLIEQYPKVYCTHLLLILPIIQTEGSNLNILFQNFIDTNLQRLFCLRILDVEVSYRMDTESFRHVSTIVSGSIVDHHLYRSTNGSLVSSSEIKGPLHFKRIPYSYPPKEEFQSKRHQAHLIGTTYAYDIPTLFDSSLRDTQSSSISYEPLRWTELVLDDCNSIQKSQRLPGNNDIGIVAWLFELCTLEYPDGRSVIVVANDITHKMGSFGPREDIFFYNVIQFARSSRIPLIYFSSNSGARIGLAEEVKRRFKVSWKNDNPLLGVDYLYLDRNGYNDLVSNTDNPAVLTEPIIDGAETRYKITSILGQANDLGVENLQGSGLVAGAMCQAYRDIFTLTIVSGRSVGIGAYLARLSSRIIQVRNSSLILTGAAALNQLLGKNVYYSNIQLGGTQIMYNNGTSSVIANNERDAVKKCLQWLSFCPNKSGGALPLVSSVDPIDRDIIPLPLISQDPRILLIGDEVSGGLLDRDSFIETLSGWARETIVGRGRLGGVPIGIITAETRTTNQTTPADPADVNSSEQDEVRAGQVWYPGSAFKTAQSIRDFQREGLPLLILANWRGFSGGQQDMMREILKYGSMIVDALQEYTWPIIVYIIGELRGGAWVVLDRSINPTFMEMYAETAARASVLEPKGIVEIKFRHRDLMETISRLDQETMQLRLDLKTADNEKDSQKYELQIKNRIKEVEEAYKQASILFADLHDTSDRMLAKNTICDIIPWKLSRQRLYWRFLYLLKYQDFISQLLLADPNLTRETAAITVESWIQGTSDEEKYSFCSKHSHNIEQRILEKKHEYLATQLSKSLENHDVLALLAERLDKHQKEKLVKLFQ